MASSRSTNTMAEFLQRMLSDISVAKTLPDADLGFLIQMETGILQKLRAPIDAMAGQMQNGQQGDPSQGGQPQPDPNQMAMAGGGGDPNAQPGAGMMAGAGPGGMTPNLPPRVTGTRMEPNMPNPDELRRIFQK